MPDIPCRCHAGIVADNQLTSAWIPSGVHYAPYALCPCNNAVVRCMAANLNGAALNIGPVGMLVVSSVVSRFLVHLTRVNILLVVIYYNGMISSAAVYVLPVISHCRHYVCDGHHYHGSYHFIHYVLHNFQI